MNKLRKPRRPNMTMKYHDSDDTYELSNILHEPVQPSHTKHADSQR